MARRTMNKASIGLDVLNSILPLEGAALLDQVTLELHAHYQSHCTCIVSIDKLRYNAQTLSHAKHGALEADSTFPLSGTPTEYVARSEDDYLWCGDNIQELFPNDPNIPHEAVRSYLGIPLTSQTGEVLGVLLSVFSEPLKEADNQNLISDHKMFANLVVHGLRAEWLLERSDSLVNQLSYEVSHDNLTHLMNRSYLSDKLEVLIETTEEPFSLAYLDIDNFKQINDFYGTYIGDQVLCFVAKVIQQAIPEEQLTFRTAGDEFAFITYSEDPLKICSKIIRRLEQGYSDPAHEIKIDASIGIARRFEKSVSPDQLILNTSLALKDCKRSRSLRIQCYDTHLSAKYYRRTMVINALRQELFKPNSSPSEIYILAQPIVHRDKELWDYFEILARWKSQTLGDVYPIEFIEAAEQSGLIVDLGERIVELACAAKLELEQGLGYKVRFSLNCSAHELNDSSRYLSHLINTIENYGFEPSEFTIELTETVLLTQTSEVRFILDKLRQLGFRVALDDFGTGYSSLNYIHSYPIDCIKIDASFTRNMLDSVTSESLVWLIIQLAEKLNVSLVAEGVETQEALDKLFEMGCNQIQGYYYSRPETPNAIINYFKNIRPFHQPDHRQKSAS